MLQKILHKCSKKIVMHGVSISRHIKPISDSEKKINSVVYWNKKVYYPSER